MMMGEDEEQYAEEPQIPSSLNLPLLSRDDATWKEFGADIMADAALRGKPRCWNNPSLVLAPTPLVKADGVACVWIS